MRPSERIGRGISKVFTWLCITAVMMTYGCYWYLKPLLTGIVSCILLGIYISVCIESIKTYYKYPLPENLPKRNLLWPIVKCLDRNYKEE